jgi:hypothetical protein
MLAWWNLGLPRLVFSPEAPIHARIDVLERFNRNTRVLVLDQAWWSANPPACAGGRWNAAFVTSGGGSPPAAARRPAVLILVG